MVKIKSSAPGKIILHGEHAVVYDKNAIAVSVNLKTNVKIDKLNEVEKIVLNCLNFNKKFEWSFDEIKQINFNNKNVSDGVPLYDEKIINQFKFLFETFEIQDKFAYETVKGFLFIYLNICQVYNNSKPLGMELTIDSEIPIGAGMGSSASFSVALIGALGKAFGIPNLNKEFICRFAFECERVFHGKPSGIDNSVCTYGGIILFKNNLIVDKLNELNTLKMLVVYTNVQRNTKELILKTSFRRKLFPSIMENINNSIDEISLIQWKQIQLENNFEKIQTLIQINQHLLNGMGVGHPAIDEIVQLASKFKLPAKLTGAGGGGCVLVLFKPDSDDDVIEKLIDELKIKNYTSWKVKVGSEGINVECL